MNIIQQLEVLLDKDYVLKVARQRQKYAPCSRLLRRGFRPNDFGKMTLLLKLL